MPPPKEPGFIAGGDRGCRGIPVDSLGLSVASGHLVLGERQLFFRKLRAPRRHAGV
jgi:outer membrane translocation and assembly module TamA